jgi:integrase
MKGFSKTQYPNLIKNDSSGIYYARTRAGKGRRIARSLETDLISIARLKLPRVLASIRATAGRLRGGSLTLAECAAVFLERKRVQGHKGRLLKPRSLKYRSETIEMLRRTWPGFDAQRVALVTLADCKAWADRARARYSGTRFNGMVESLRGIFMVALEAGAAEANLALAIPRAKIVSDKFIPDREQFTEILRRLDSRPERKFAGLCVRGLAFTGLRPNEARHVAEADIDLKAMTLLARVTKNGAARTIDLGNQAVELFESDMAGVLKAFKKSPRRALNTICRQMKLPGLTPYTFRHLHMTRLLECGVNIEAVASQAGHRDRGVTLLRRYIHPRRESIRKQMRQVVI